MFDNSRPIFEIPTNGRNINSPMFGGSVDGLKFLNFNNDDSICMFN